MSGKKQFIDSLAAPTKDAVQSTLETVLAPIYEEINEMKKKITRIDDMEKKMEVMVTEIAELKKRLPKKCVRRGCEDNGAIMKYCKPHLEDDVTTVVKGLGSKLFD